MKKILSFFLSVCLIITVCGSGLMSLTAFAVQKIDGSDVTWNFDNFTKTLTFDGTGAIPDFDSYKNDDGDSILPWASIDFSKVVFGEGITAIGNYAFYSSIALEDITIPENIAAIGKGAFFNCKALKEITITSPKIQKIEDSTFSGCTTLQAVNLPDSISEIGSQAFYKCNSLQSIKLPSSLVSIGEAAFHSCYSLTQFKANEKLEKIGARAFYCCEVLETVELSENTLSIGNSAFDGCEDLTSIALPLGTLTVSTGAFSGCKKLSEVLLPEGLKTIEANAFNLCSSLKAVTVPYSVETIGTKALGYSNGGKTVEGFVITGYDNSAAQKYASENKGITFNSLGDYYAKSGTISETLTWKITDENMLVFEGTGAIGNYSIYSLPPYMHNDFEYLSLGEGITSIGDYAFVGDFTSFYIPSSVTHIGEKAIGYTFDENGKIVKNSSISLSFTEDNMVAKDYADANGLFTLPVIFSGECGDYTKWIYNGENEVLTIYGTDNIYYNFGYDLPGMEYSDWPVAKVIVKEGVININDQAFCKFIPNEKNITYCIPQSVTTIAPKSIGYYAVNEPNEDGDVVTDYIKITNCTIMGYTGSAAERYATENNINFVELDEATIALMTPSTEFKLNENAPIAIDEESKTITLYEAMSLDTLLTYFTVGEDIKVSVDSLSTLIPSGSKITVTYGKTKLYEYTVIGMGDVDNNQMINSADALKILQYSVGELKLNDIEKISADITGDGSINSQDALQILRISVGQTKLADYMKSDDAGSEDDKKEDDKKDEGGSSEGENAPTDEPKNDTETKTDAE